MSNDSSEDNQSNILENFNRINEKSDLLEFARNQRVQNYLANRESNRQEMNNFVEKWLENRNSLINSKQNFVERYANSYIKKRNSSKETKKLLFDRDIMIEGRLRRNKAKIEVAKMSFEEFEENLTSSINESFSDKSN